jgi:hypothetical protein
MQKIDNDNLSTPTPVEPVENHAPRISVLNYFSDGTGRFMRLFSSREKLVEGLKTFAWVAPLTLLIWIYAVREQVVQPTTPNVLGVEVRINSSDQNRFVDYVGSDQVPTVNLQLTGPQQAVDLVKQQLLTGSIPHGLKIDIGSSLGIGRNQPVNIVDRIQNQDIFKLNGVTVQLSQPPEISVNIEHKVSHPLPVGIPSSVTNLSPDSRFEPATVMVTGPESLFTGDLKVVAKLDGYEQLKHSGTQTIPNVPLGFATPLKNLWFSPTQVTANLVVNESDVTYVVPTVPIYETMAGSRINRYEFTLSADRLNNIHIKGSQQAINAVKEAISDAISKGKETFPVKAYLDLTQDDLTPVDTDKDSSHLLRFELPEGVTVAKEDESQSVDFKLKLRQ